jgi:putative transposase
MTGFSEGETFKLGEQAIARISRLCVHLDRLYSKMKNATARRRYRLRKAAAKMRWKLVDLIDELHWKTIRFLLDNYDLILLPSFETSKMSSRLQRRLSKKSVRNMLSLKHYQFKMRLKNKCQTEGLAFIEVNEAFTSKTASWTGEMKHNLGSAKFITSDGITVDRDVNGARGIFLRALVDTPSLRNQ